MTFNVPNWRHFLSQSTCNVNWCAPPEVSQFDCLAKSLVGVLREKQTQYWSSLPSSSKTCPHCPFPLCLLLPIAAAIFWFLPHKTLSSYLAFNCHTFLLFICSNKILVTSTRQKITCHGFGGILSNTYFHLAFQTIFSKLFAYFQCFVRVEMESPNGFCVAGSYFRKDWFRFCRSLYFWGSITPQIVVCDFLKIVLLFWFKLRVRLLQFELSFEIECILEISLFPFFFSCGVCETLCYIYMLMKVCWFRALFLEMFCFGTEMLWIAAMCLIIERE